MEPSVSIQAGNVKKVIHAGKRYFFEFETPTTGQAYFRIKNPETGEESKGELAGSFTTVPKTVITPSGGTPTPVARDNKKVVPEVIKEIPKPKPTATAPAKREVKPPPPPTPLKQVAKGFTGYFQGQEGLGCGRHALNNLFGRKVFIKGAKTDKIDAKPGTEPYSLLGICQAVEAILKRKGQPGTCSISENYDVNTIHGALDYLGYRTHDSTRSDELDETGDFVGFVINLGLVEGKPKHWVALRFKSRQEDGTVLYDYYDSLNDGPVENIPFSVFALQHPVTYVVKVLLPKEETISLEERMILMENVVPEKPKAKTAAAALPTDCSKLYDPCTRLEVKDLPALEARVAELKAKQAKAGGSRKKSKKSGRKTRRGRRV